MLASQRKGEFMLILGIDPGSRNLGFGLVRQTGTQLKHVHHGVIRVEGLFSLRLATLSQELGALIESHSPDAVVLEKIFLGKNVDSAFKLGHARGVCILEAAKRQLPVFEYEARVVKKGITGSGAATKEQVSLLVKAMLGLTENTSNQSLDATDALSIACHHARVRDVRARFEQLKIDPPADLGQPL